MSKRALLGVLATSAAFAASGGSALAVSPGYYGDVPNGNHGNSGNAPGQARAADNCTNTYQQQIANGVSPGGGPKASSPFAGSTNCDHIYQSTELGGPFIGPGS
jgi:hypothetical protein